MSKINRGGRQTQSSTYVQIDLAGQVPGAPGQAFGHCELCVHGLHRLLKCQRGAPFKTNHTLSSATTALPAPTEHRMDESGEKELQ